LLTDIKLIFKTFGRILGWIRLST